MKKLNFIDFMEKHNLKKILIMKVTYKEFINKIYILEIAKHILIKYL